MEIIIKISDEDYERLKLYKKAPFNSLTSRVYEAVANGTVVPKGHGRLGDLDKIKKELQNYHDDCAKTGSVYTKLGFQTAMAVVENADTIIGGEE